MHHSFKPKYYDLVGDKNTKLKVIQANHVACFYFYGVIMVRIWSNNNSINNMWSVCEVLDVVPSVKQYMPQDAYKDFYCCIHCVDDLEVDMDKKLDNYISNLQVEGDNTTATHQIKFDIVEDGFNSW